MSESVPRASAATRATASSRPRPTETTRGLRATREERDTAGASTITTQDTTHALRALLPTRRRSFHSCCSFVVQVVETRGRPRHIVPRLPSRTNALLEDGRFRWVVDFADGARRSYRQALSWRVAEFVICHWRCTDLRSGQWAGLTGLGRVLTVDAVLLLHHHHLLTLLRCVCWG